MAMFRELYQKHYFTQKYTAVKKVTTPKILEIPIADDESPRLMPPIHSSLAHDRKGIGCSVGTAGEGALVGCGLGSINQSLHSGQYPV